MQSEMSRLDDPAMRANNPFWADGARARSFALLRLWVERVPTALKYCQRVLGGIHAQFYPLAVVPSKLETLCRFFTQPSELRRLMDHQIQARARVALGLVHSHWPGVDFAEVVRGPPGGKDHSMDSHYAAVDGLAGRVVKRVVEESDRYLGACIRAKQEPKD